MPRKKLGDRAICVHCGAEIEWHQKPRREQLLPGVTIVRGGWLDRGCNRRCDTNRRRLHKGGVS